MNRLDRRSSENRKLKRCKICGKGLRGYNGSGLCNYHFRQNKLKEWREKKNGHGKNNVNG